MGLFKLWFSLSAPVGRTAYLISGLGLAAVKFAVDNAIVYQGTGGFWHPLAYLIPSLALREAMAASDTPTAVHLALALASLPFLWIGLTMSIRRAVDAGLDGAVGFFFLFPLFNYLMILALVAFPTRPMGAQRLIGDVGARTVSAPTPEGAATVNRSMVDPLVALVVPILFGLLMTIVAVYGADSYGAALFFVTPGAMGFMATVLLNRRGRRSFLGTLLLSNLAVAGAGAALLLFALEGVLCLAMAAPLALLMTTMVACATYGILYRFVTPPGVGTIALAFLVVPGCALLEGALGRPVLREAVTTVEIDAPPAVVWNHVTGFSELPAPPDWLFRLGIAYPQRARIDGSGVGAVRHCEFSTGPFVEPITVWEPPRRLGFDVIDQPATMQEWSPYRHVAPPHLEGFMVSERGEFRLVPLDGGRRTRLEGSTFYRQAMFPEAYWVIPTELILHAIHRRVLSHIKALSQSEAAGNRLARR